MKSACIATLALAGIVSSVVADTVPVKSVPRRMRRQLEVAEPEKETNAEAAVPTLYSTEDEAAVPTLYSTEDEAAVPTLYDEVPEPVLINTDLDGEEPYDSILGMASMPIAMSMSMSMPTGSTDDEKKSDVNIQESTSPASSSALSGLVSAVCIAGAYAFM